MYLWIITIDRTWFNIISSFQTWILSISRINILICLFMAGGVQQVRNWSFNGVHEEEKVRYSPFICTYLTSKYLYPRGKRGKKLNLLVGNDIENADGKKMLFEINHRIRLHNNISIVAVIFYFIHSFLFYFILIYYISF